MENKDKVLEVEYKYLDSGIIDLLIGGLYIHLHHKLLEKQNENKQDAKDQTEIKPLTQEEKELRLKVKFFKITIKKGIFGSSQIWEMREEPLSDEDLESFFTNRSNKN